MDSLGLCSTLEVMTLEGSDCILVLRGKLGSGGSPVVSVARGRVSCYITDYRHHWPEQEDKLSATPCRRNQRAFSDNQQSSNPTLSVFGETIGKRAVSQSMTHNRLLIDPDGEGLQVRDLFGKTERFDIFCTLMLSNKLYL